MQTTTYAEHRTRVATVEADLVAAARALHLTNEERELVELIRQHSPSAMRGMTSLLRRALA